MLWEWAERRGWVMKWVAVTKKRLRTTALCRERERGERG